MQPISVSHHGQPNYGPPTHQAAVTLTQANPVSGTIYDVLTTTKNVRIIGIGARATWTVQPSPLEVYIIIDGQTLTVTQADPVSGTTYYVVAYPYPDGTDGMYFDGGMAYHPSRAFLLEGKSVRIRAETTGGTVQELKAQVIYAKW